MPLIYDMRLWNKNKDDLEYFKSSIKENYNKHKISLFTFS